MYCCVLCNLRCSSINKIILHLKVYHNLNSHSIYTCNQGGCVRDFQGSEKFRKHLMVVHSQNVETINLDTPGLLSRATKYQYKLI